MAIRSQHVSSYAGRQLNTGPPSAGGKAVAHAPRGHAWHGLQKDLQFRWWVRMPILERG
jgi:hypothetical protein